MKTEKTIRYGLTFLALASLVACSSTPTGKRVEGITTTVDTPASSRTDELTGTMAAELESWDERLTDLRGRAMTTQSPERFDQLNEAIGDIEDQLADARKDFLNFRLASSDGERIKYKQKVNDRLADIRSVYNGVPAE